jgi:hypothetical protein
LNVRIITELVNHGNIELLEITPEDSLDATGTRKKSFRSFSGSPLYAAGCVYTASMLETLVCQAFFNPHITNMLHKLVAGDLAAHEQEDGKGPTQLVLTGSNRECLINQSINQSIHPTNQPINPANSFNL